jgi:hypothetical protein
MTTLARLAYATAHATASVGRRAVLVGLPLARVAIEARRLPEGMRPRRVAEGLVHSAHYGVATLTSNLERLITAIAVALVDDVLDVVDLNAIIGERLDLDALVASVDITQVADRVDVDAIVRRADVNAIANRIDIDAIAERIDIGSVIARIDLNELADRIDIGRLIARIDVDAIVATVDLDAVVDRIDVLGIAEYLINEIDLPEIIRDSTGTMASQVVRGARMQSIDADEAVSRLVDRVLRRQPSSGLPSLGPPDTSRR